VHTWLLAADWYLVGLAVVIATLTYPNFGRISNFDEVHRHHLAVMGWIVGPAWAAQGFGCAWLLLETFSFRNIVHGLFCAVAVIVTITSAVPSHHALSKEFTRTSWRRLQRSHWIRTFCWLSAAVILTV
jgi:uncharacterized membrane protein